MEFKKVVDSKLSELEMPRKELSKLMGISYCYLTSLLLGNKRWNEELINKACQALNIKIEFN